MRINFESNGQITYIYDASGRKISKIIGDKRTDYMDGFHFMGDVLRFFTHAEGYVNVTGISSGQGSLQRPVYDYAYNYTDHLGNIRMTYGKDRRTGVLKILEETHYYPFGLKHTLYYL